MSRAQLALNIGDLDEAITFYSKFFNTTPSKVKPGYANFAVTEPPSKLVRIENPRHGRTLNHLAVSESFGAESRILADSADADSACCTGANNDTADAS